MPLAAAQPEAAFGTHLREAVDAVKGWNRNVAGALTTNVQDMNYLTTSGTTIGPAPQGGQTFSYSNLTSSR